MKILSRLALAVLLLGCQSAYSGVSFYSLLHAFRLLSFHATPILGPLVTAGQVTRNVLQLKNLPDAPEVVTNFCQGKCKSQGLAQEIHIKVKKDGGFLEAFGSNYIIFGSESAEEFQKALEAPNDEISAKHIKVYGTFIDHEIAHIKNNDAPIKRLTALIAASSLMYAASAYIIYKSPLSSLFQKPTNLKEMVVSGLAFSAIDLGYTIAAKSLYGLYAQRQETRADAYAITQAKDSDALRCAAQFLEINDDSLIDYLCHGNAHPAIPMINRISMHYIRGAAMTKYKMQKNEEDFRSWIKNQNSFLAALKFVVDIEHPSGFSRGQVMRLAADALEAQKQ